MSERITVYTDKEINLEQLDAELGGYGLNGAEGLVQACEGSPVTEEQLTAAINAHIAAWPNLEAQNAAIEHAKSLGFTDAMIAVMYPNLGA